MQKPTVVCALLVLIAASAFAQDPATLVPDRCKVVLENEYVRVLKWTEGPGDKTPMHDHPPFVSVALSDGKTRFTLPDGTTTEAVTKAGQVTWSAALKHASENLSPAPGALIQVELKQKPGASQTPLAPAEDPVAVDPKHYKVEFQNDRVRVLRIHYGPGEKSVMHAHPASVAIFMTDTHGKFTFPDGTSAPAERKAGDAMWSEPGKHLPENVGTTPFDVILVELR